MAKYFKSPPIKKALKSKVNYGVSRIDGITSKSMGVMTPFGGSYGIKTDPYSTTYSASGTTKRGLTISANVTKSTYGEDYYGLRFSKNIGKIK